MKLKNKIIPSILTFFLMIIFFGANAEASQLNFSVNPTIPEKIQVDKTKTYYDLKLAKDQTETFEVTLKNHTKKDVTVLTSFNRATTNINGIVEYGLNENKAEDQLENDIEKIVTIDQPEIVVKPNEDKVVKLKVKMPKNDFEGVMAAGITFKEKGNEGDQEDSEQGLAIKNEYAYIVAFLLHGNKLQKDIKSELELGKVQANQVNVRNVITANIKNVKPKYVNKIEVDAKVTKKGSSETLYKLKKTELQMAPNSNFDYAIPLDGKKLKAGTYLLKMKVNSSSGDWEFEKEFKISAEESKKYNEQDVSIKKDYTWWYVAGGILLLLIIQLIVMLIIKKTKAKKKRQAVESSSKHRPKRNRSKKKSRK